MIRDDFNVNNTWCGNGNYFSMPTTPEESKVVIISAPWDVTVSYRAGTQAAPDAIIEASVQIDLYDLDNPTGFKDGIGTIPIEEEIILQSQSLRKEAVKVIESLESGEDIENEHIQKRLKKVNQGSSQLNQYIYNTSKEWLDKGKIVALVGGDHSTPFGHIKAVSEHYDNLSILHIDAHADLRNCYEGFEFSHASIFYNTITKIDSIDKLVQVGIRDFCQEEIDFINQNDKITTFFDAHLSERQFEGENWKSICQDIVSTLSQNVYISFDIDGLSPDNCPSTGTPVAGGLSFAQATYLLKQIALSGRKIVAFDLCEVAPSTVDLDQWDANVGARILYKMCNLALMSNKG